MNKKFGMILALFGAMAFYGSNSALSSPAEPNSIADYIKLKREREAQAKAKAAPAAKITQSKEEGKRVVAKAPATKKAAAKQQRVSKKSASHKRPVVQAKARIKTTVVNETIASVDTMTTGSIASAGASAIGGTKYSTIINSYAASYGVPVALANAVIRVESNYQPNMTGSAGEIGLMQIKYETARGLGYTGTRQALYNPEENIRWGMKYLAGAHKLGNGTTCGTILRYNAGHGATRMNPVSANYCAKVKLEMASN
ncbi:Transglycosylase SLT domain-containing protein [Phyllobacterium sp. CL33Tsu]|uniref:lytic transglycosylase domain-containing protein n=1 Tax=Phyllobacterium sp. CL33Tsu TaxID=1798191 RepID=UPI0008F4019A|nr:Transglycosylase SLT domain-containing protein [Phyllobacterium sp. CL33Tsu]